MKKPLALAPERVAIDQGWFYVAETEASAARSTGRVLRSRAQEPLTRRAHGYRARVLVTDHSPHHLPVAAWLRTAEAMGRALEAAGRPGPVEVRIEGTAGEPSPGTACLDGHWLAQQTEHHSVRTALSEAVPAENWSAAQGSAVPVRRILAFESLMATDMPHNDKEISQGVLHMLAPLADRDVDVILACVKMPIVGDDRGPSGLEHLDENTVASIDLVLLSVLEGYWHGAVKLIEHLRALGCRAHIAVGGVMPTLTPEHVAAHLPGVSFVCRGAGEYFVPRLVELFGGSSVDRPFTDHQVGALLQMKGLIAIDRSGRRLIAAMPAQTVAVEQLDTVELDLSHVQARHIEGGIEITTSRGCIHRCTFCSIIGRESYQARSSENVFALLQRYEQRYSELFDGPVPPNAYRVHIADDDFACDRPRAKHFFRHLRRTPFRLSSVQVSVADLCLRVDGKLIPEVDPEWLEVITPDCFADHGRPITRAERLHDQQHRGWSAYLQIGVETFSERELVRLGKGYRVAHIRAAVHALSTHDLHHDAYFIQSNTHTRAADLLESTTELCRLKIRYPEHFHLKFPVVPHLVSYFPTATFRRKVRGSRLDSVTLIDTLHVPGHPELDYPLVGHDIPDSTLVETAVTDGFLVDSARYTDSLVRLRELWSSATGLEGEDARDQEFLVRRLDDLPRRLVFQALEDARHGGQGRRIRGWAGPPSQDEALRAARDVLGDRSAWLPAYKRWATDTAPRLVVIPTWQCELRCTYCYIPKQDGRVMAPRTLTRSLELLMSSSRPQVMLQFFGGEALLEWELVQQGIAEGAELARRHGKQISFILSSNGWSLDADKLRWLADYPVKLELSLDGDRVTQNKFRHSREKTGDSYDTGIAPRARAIVDSGLDYDVIMVVHPLNAHLLYDNFFHVVGLGFRRVQINVGLGVIWRKHRHQAFVEQLHKVGRELLRRWNDGDDLVFVNAEQPPMAIRLNGEVTVDHDGTVYGGNAFLHETEHKQRFVVGHLDDASNFDRYWLDGPGNDELLAWSYPPDITKNNLAVGKTLRNFCTWLRKQAPPQAPLLMRGESESAKRPTVTSSAPS